jgi:hypothetical protein
MVITSHGRKAVQSAAFAADLRRMARQYSGEALVVYTAIVLCANAKGVTEADDAEVARFCNDDDELTRFCNENAVEIGEAITSALAVA